VSRRAERVRRGTASCSATHWVGAWAAVPSDASQGTSIADLFDPTVHPKTPAIEQSDRVILTPALGGAEVRVHLSNRFGTQALTSAGRPSLDAPPAQRSCREP